jgi:hypothetical protein
MKIPQSLLNSTLIALRILNLGICVIVNGNVWTIGWRKLLHFNLVVMDTLGGIITRGTIVYVCVGWKTLSVLVGKPW